MNAPALLEKYFAENLTGLAIVVEHSRLVAAKAIAVGKALKLAPAELQFIEEAALLHDIGVCRIKAPHLDCHGSAPYISHGIIGRQILDAEQLPLHALVCERHIGVGLTVADIIQQQLPLPHRAMAPTTLAEEIVCFADLFYSKTPDRLCHEKSVAEIRQGLHRFGPHKVGIFDNWQAKFCYTVSE